MEYPSQSSDLNPIEMFRESFEIGRRCKKKLFELNFLFKGQIVKKWKN